MSVVIVTGSNGLVGSAAVKFLSKKGFEVIGIDNNMREAFFGKSGSTEEIGSQLKSKLGNYVQLDKDIRDFDGLSEVFRKYGNQIHAIIHCAAQPSHDWAARNPILDFEVNALGTLNLLELTRVHCPESRFIFMSTNKVYGDRPNEFEYVEDSTRWNPAAASPWGLGFSEELSIDSSTHSIFGVSKASADLMTQEYGRYFGLNTAVFRGGCLTGPDHAGVELHGFLSYLIKCVVGSRPYVVFGHKAKQVRDNIHTDDLVEAFWEFILKPGQGAVYNMGGGVSANVSMLEAISIAQEISGKELKWTVDESPRKGDHIWYISDTKKFEIDYPNWRVTLGIREILSEMISREFDQLKNSADK
jgi:CDP-paratose 2-epimerase